MENNTQRLINNHKAVDYYESIIPQVQKISQDFLTQTGTSHFWYNRYYSNGTGMTINNLKNYNDKIILEHDMLDFPQIWKQIDNNLAVGEHYKSMWSVTDETLIKISKELNIYQPFNIFYKTKDYLEGIGLASNNHNSDLYNFFLNAEKLCTKFLEYFKKEAAFILKQAEKVLIEIPSVEPSNFKIHKPSRIIPNFTESTPITAKELYCLRLLSKGQSYKEIAYNLEISTRTVEAHIINIKNKTGYYNRSKLVDYYNKIA